MTGKKVPTRIKRLVALYNILPNTIWSVLNLLPISIFCYSLINLQLFYTFLIISLLSIFLPQSCFNRIQLEKTPSFYKKTGVTFINRFTQNGDVINGLIRKKFPQYKVVSTGRQSINKVLQQTYMFEKFHFAMFLSFILITIYAVKYDYLWWAFILSVNNIIYNVYPCILQQYIRVRLQLSGKVKAT